ncbi:MAG TPA: vitamin B12-dependent ribonucleotide reductase [bacterium]|nr:vitamin B12-dependent ribonucleotide reductase [bacterium]
MSTHQNASAKSSFVRPNTFTREGGLKIKRYFTKKGLHPFEEVEWELRSATITDEKGKVIFEQKDVEVPKGWSQIAINIVVSKYFHGLLGSEERERSVKQLIRRVADTISEWGHDMGYFASDEDADVFHMELTHLLVHQKMAFNSPVWFNVGIEERPQCSACFINSVSDSMESILDLAKTEGMLFKYGSGTGTNFSALRSSKEKLSGGGTASGPVSFLKGFDSFAGVIKSGGRTRRAAKMVILDADHPDIVEFIKSKSDEEKKAWALIEAGYDGGFNVPGGAYDSVQFQNANHSVRVSDEFMQAASHNGTWTTKSRKDGSPMDTYNAKDLLRMIAESTWICGDPGMQFDTTINKWHTSSATARINSSNPCSEYMYLDDSACNLASLNLMKFRTADSDFDIEAFKHAVDVTILAQEITVDNASYPTKPIERNSHDYRPLGLGYANLGALLMSRGLPYDGDLGRNYAAAITALMQGEANLMSSRIAKEVGPFRGYARNREPMLKVMKMHQTEAAKISRDGVAEDLWLSAQAVWKEVQDHGKEWGFRNGQVSVLAPTGTIGFMMDCDTTGVEPDIALVKYKKLVGGGVIKIVNQTVPEALKNLKYSESQAKDILDYINAHDTIEGAPHLKPEHLPVFDCAFKPSNGTRSIHYMGHIRMMAAVQPFLSGAISKTVNLPNDATVEDIMQAYIESWKLGLKAVAIYRDGCKRSQPLSTNLGADGKPKGAKPARRRLPDEREAITHKFSIAGHEGYITVGKFEDGTPGELFILMSKEGSTVSGLMDSFATAISLALQYGVPLKVLVDKFSHSRYEPSGITTNPEVRIAKSITDYIFRWMALKFMPEGDRGAAGIPEAEERKAALNSASAATAAPAASAPPTVVKMVEGARDSDVAEKRVFVTQADAPPCPECGTIMVRNAACYKCLNCGSTSGCS